MNIDPLPSIGSEWLHMKEQELYTVTGRLVRLTRYTGNVKAHLF